MPVRPTPPVLEGAALVFACSFSCRSEMILAAVAPTYRRSIMFT